MSRAITVKSLLELDQAQLLKLLIERRGQDEAFDVHVTDLDALSSKERELLATKLQEAAQEASNPNDAVLDPLDFANQLTARLNGLQSREPSPEIDRGRRQTLSPESDGELLEKAKKAAHKSYHELSKRGGRPLYHLDMLDAIAESPSQYADLLQPWAENVDSISKDDWNVFHSQVEFWQAFQLWQSAVRGTLEENDKRNFECFLKWRKDVDESDEANYDQEKDYYMQCLRDTWEDRKYYASSLAERAAKQYSIDSSKAYQAAIRQFLTKATVHETFVFEEDPLKQDNLSTWLEFIFYTSFLADIQQRAMAKQENICDAKWQELSASRFIEAAVLKPTTVEAMDTYIKKLAQSKLPSDIELEEERAHTDPVAMNRQAVMDMISAAGNYRQHSMKYNTYLLRKEASIGCIPAVKAEQEPRAPTTKRKFKGEALPHKLPTKKRKRSDADNLDMKESSAKTQKTGTPPHTSSQPSRQSPKHKERLPQQATKQGKTDRELKNDQPVTAGWQSRLRKRPQQQIISKDELKPPPSRNKSVPRSKNKVTKKEQTKAKKKKAKTESIG